MNIEEILLTSNQNSNHMYFNNTYLYFGNDIAHVREVRENSLLLRRVNKRMSFEVNEEEYQRLRMIEVPNFYYRWDKNQETNHKDFEYVYVYRSPKRSHSKGFNFERYRSDNPLFSSERAIKALQNGEVIFSDKYATEERMWFQGYVVGTDNELFNEFKWLEE